MPFCHKVPADAGRVGPPIFCWADSWTVLRVSGWTRGGHLDTFPHNCQDVGGACAGAWVALLTESLRTTWADPLAFSGWSRSYIIENITR